MKNSSIYKYFYYNHYYVFIKKIFGENLPNLKYVENVENVEKILSVENVKNVENFKKI